MRLLRNKAILSLMLLTFVVSSCDDFYDINKDPNNILQGPLSNQLTSLTVNIGYWAGSDFNRNSLILSQQYSGQSTGAETQTQQYEKYLISGNDFNNGFSTLYATILNDIENIIQLANQEGSPHYSGVAKILKAYCYQIAVDGWGDLPLLEAQQLTGNLDPAYDNDADIYAALITLLNEGIAEVSAPTSVQSPGTNSTIFPGIFVKTSDPLVIPTGPKWIKLANTLKLRIFLHYSEVDAAFAKTQIDALIESKDTFLTSNADNFQMNFINAANSRNPIDQFETGRAGYLVANNLIVSMMNAKLDPRRASYFTQYPAGSGSYVGSIGGAPASQNYSKFHTYLRGTLTGTTYSGSAPIRMLTFAEYNFIRAEAALRFGSEGSAATFYQDGIRASMENAGVAEADIVTYLTANGTLTGTTDEQLEQIIEEKYVASYGVVMESWSDWRRTGFPAAIVPPANAVVNFVPRSWYYPQSEIDFNRSSPGQKSGLDVRVFWDTRP